MQAAPRHDVDGVKASSLKGWSAARQGSQPYVCVSHRAGENTIDSVHIHFLSEKAKSPSDMVISECKRSV